eukprot:TRINITY_DN35_c0_g1_i2.p1 TRINITY_DN35_c0_g1~~TRINITY_DN35_c0_g1_i2.p1  ORF type:complete len:823 (-),score=149.26 TRINITY_DN35_c0_g1_i2:578-3046(-)
MVRLAVAAAFAVLSSQAQNLPNFSVGTFNAAIAGAIAPLSTERVPFVSNVVQASPFQVLCLQEVFSTSAAATIQAAAATNYPYSYYPETTVSSLGNQCQDAAALVGLSTCVAAFNCTSSPDPLLQQQCAYANCVTEITALTSECFSCIGNYGIDGLDLSTAITRCTGADGGGPAWFYEGRTGLMLLSKVPFDATNHTFYSEANIVRRGIITALVTLPGVGLTTVGCTQLQSNSVGTPWYLPREGLTATSFQTENLKQIAEMHSIMASVAAQAFAQWMYGPVFILGDFNTGPETKFADAAWSENYAALLQPTAALPGLMGTTPYTNLYVNSLLPTSTSASSRLASVVKAPRVRRAHTSQGLVGADLSSAACTFCNGVVNFNWLTAPLSVPNVSSRGTLLDGVLAQLGNTYGTVMTAASAAAPTMRERRAKASGRQSSPDGVPPDPITLVFAAADRFADDALTFQFGAQQVTLPPSDHYGVYAGFVALGHLRILTPCTSTCEVPDDLVANLTAVSMQDGSDGALVAATCEPCTSSLPYRSNYTNAVEHAWTEYVAAGVTDNCPASLSPASSMRLVVSVVATQQTQVLFLTQAIRAGEFAPTIPQASRFPDSNGAEIGGTGIVSALMRIPEGQPIPMTGETLRPGNTVDYQCASAEVNSAYVSTARQRLAPSDSSVIAPAGGTVMIMRTMTTCDSVECCGLIQQYSVPCGAELLACSCGGVAYPCAEKGCEESKKGYLGLLGLLALIPLILCCIAVAAFCGMAAKRKSEPLVKQPFMVAPMMSPICNVPLVCPSAVMSSQCHQTIAAPMACGSIMPPATQMFDAI